MLTWKRFNIINRNKTANPNRITSSIHRKLNPFLPKWLSEVEVWLFYL